MNVLIFGGTGAMGAHLVSILAKRGITCVVTTRQHLKNKENVEYVIGDAHHIDFISSLFTDHQWDAIVDFMKYSTKDFESRVNILLSNTKQYVYLSSSRVYAESNKPLTEQSSLLLDVCQDDDYLKTDEYALAKARQERLLQKTGKRNWTIIRPYVTFSEQRLQLSALEKEYWLYRALKGRTIVFSKDLAERMTTFTYGYDVAKTIAYIIGQESAYGEIFHVTNGISYKWQDILSVYLDIIEKEMGVAPHVKILESWKPYLGGNKYQVKWDRLYDREFNNTKINNYIDTSTFQDTISALSNCLKSFLHNPKFKRINWRSEALKDRATGEWANIKEMPGVKQKLVYFFYRMGLY
jgi:nucleoside-diphosphate-sugar epimerase